MFIRLVIFIFINFLKAQDDGLPPNYVYLEPIEDFYARNSIRLEVIVTDRNPIETVAIFYRFSGNIDYSKRDMMVSYQPVIYEVEIPLEEVESGFIQYYFWAKDTFGNNQPIESVWNELGYAVNGSKPVNITVE